jgi:hypothetical protein
MADTDLAGDLLEGAEAIAKFTGKTTRQVYHLASAGALPVFWVAGKLHARKSELNAAMTSRSPDSAQRPAALSQRGRKRGGLRAGADYLTR